ncbi:virulence factor TspB C-terminal domain-related protein [Pseudaeromonas paramecii]|uniref:TspB protein n=1 Tax=Pseudaeromonas paramecii TaxID=2138166 RepID=A0ABP8PX78_9GAMM
MRYFFLGVSLMLMVGTASASTMSAVAWEQGVTFGGSAGTIRKGVTVFSPLGDALIAGEVRALGSKFAVSATARLAAARMGTIIGLGLRAANPLILGATLLAYLAEGGISLEDGEYVIRAQSTEHVDPKVTTPNPLVYVLVYYNSSTLVYTEYYGLTKQQACSVVGGSVGGSTYQYCYATGFTYQYKVGYCSNDTHVSGSSYCASNPSCPPEDGSPYTELRYADGVPLCYLPDSIRPVVDSDWSNLPAPSQAVAVAYANEVAGSDDELPIDSTPVSVGGSDAKLIGNAYIKDGAWYADYATTTVYPSGTSAVTTVEPVLVSDDTTTTPNVADTITNVDNSSSSSSSVTEVDSVDYCVDNPTRSGCATLDSPDSEDLDVDTIDFSINALSPFGADDAACPSPKPLIILGQSIEFSYQPVCDFFTGIRPIVIAVAWLSAILLSLGLGGKGNE